MSYKSIRKSKIELNKKYGRLIPVEFLYKKRKNGWNVSYVKCICECGNIVEVIPSKLTSGSTKSCGCYKLEVSKRKDNKIKHGLSYHELYPMWNNMMNRCFNSDNYHYRDYGARGIIVCERWKTIESFIEDAISIGYTKGLTIDRINNDGNYEPTNVRFVDRKIQCNNTRRNIVVDHNGEKRTLSQWAEFYGIKYHNLWYRINIGVPFDIAIDKRSFKDVDTIFGVNDAKDNVWIEYNGMKKTLAQWARFFGFSYSTLRNRIARGMYFEDAIKKENFRGRAKNIRRRNSDAI